MIASRFRSVHRGLLVVLALLIAFFPLALTDVGGVRAQTPTELEIQILDTGFDPAEATVPVGTNVTWVNRGSEQQTLISLEGDFEPIVFEVGDDLSIMFAEAGSYTFQLESVPDAVGTIEVTTGVRDLDALEVTEAPSTPAAATQVDTASLAGPARDLAPVETPRLAHIHAGTCEELGIVVYSLAGSQGYLSEPETDNRGPAELLVGTANVPLANLFNEPFSIHVHQDTVNKQNYIACADVGGRPAAPWTEADGLVLSLDEQQGSGLAGYAALRPAADGGTAVSLFLGGAVGADETPVAATTTTPPTTYTSPTFGYSISYNDTWDVSEDVSGNGRDRFVLTNGTSFVTFTGAPGFDGNPQQCVEAFVEDLTADPNVSDVAVAIGPDGEPLIGGTEATGAFAIYNHDYRFTSGVVPYTLFVGCIPLIPNEAVLAVVQNSPTADFDSQIEPREGLLRGLALEQVADTPVPTPPAEVDQSQDLTAADLEYVTYLRDDLQAVTDSSFRVGDLFENPRLGDPDWTIAVATEFAIFRSLYAEAQTVTPPSRFSDIHATFVELLRLLDSASYDLAAGLDASDASLIELGTNKIIQASVLMEDLSRMLTEMEQELGE